MKRHLAFAGAAALAGITLHGAAPRAQDDLPQGRQPMVFVDVFVSTRSGAPAFGLTPDDFEIRSDGRPQSVVRASAAPMPLNIVFLVDVSISARRDWKTSLGDVAVTLADTLRDGDRGRIGRIAATIALSPWSSDREELARSGTAVLDVPREERYGPSPVWDATDAALASLAEAQGRRAIVLVTDGRATGNQRGLDEVRAQAMAGGVVVNAITGLAEGIASAGAVGPVGPLASSTGGRAVGFSDAGGRGAVPFSAIVRLIVDELRSSYRVAFVPDRADGATHRLTVTVKRAGFSVRAREQYVAEAGHSDGGQGIRPAGGRPTAPAVQRGPERP